MRQEADQEGMGRHEDDRRCDRLPLDLEGGDPEGEVGRQDCADERHHDGVSPRDSEEGIRLSKQTAAQQNRRTDDSRGDREAIEGDRDGRRARPGDEDRGEGDRDDGEGNCRVRASPHRLRTGARLSNPYGVASSSVASSDGARSFGPPTISREARKSMQLSDIKKVAVIGPLSFVFPSNPSRWSTTKMPTATKRADRVVGMHFFNPAPVMKLVEVIRGSETSEDTLRLIKEVCMKLGKEAVEVKESPGFVVNRLLVPMMNEAFNLLQEGFASPEDIDKAMKLGTNMPMGPFELADYTGLDIGLDVMEVLFRETGDPKFRPSTLLRKYVRAGRLGRKSGRGVYNYTGA